MLAVDQRDALTWVVVELTRAGEALVEDGTLAQALRDAVGADRDHPVFVPSTVYTRGGRRTAITLMEGYAFIATGLPDTCYFAMERECPLVRQVLSMGGDDDDLRVLSTLPNSNIEEMRAQLRQQVSTDLDVGMQVVVTEGVYENLDAEVMGFEDDDAVVSIELRSIKIITKLPRVFLEPQEDDDGG